MRHHNAGNKRRKQANHRLCFSRRYRILGFVRCPDNKPDSIRSGGNCNLQIPHSICPADFTFHRTPFFQNGERRKRESSVPPSAGECREHTLVRVCESEDNGTRFVEIRADSRITLFSNQYQPQHPTSTSYTACQLVGEYDRMNFSVIFAFGKARRISSLCSPSRSTSEYR